MSDNGPITESIYKKIRYFERGVEEGQDVCDLSESEIENRREEMDTYRKCREAVKTLSDACNGYSRTGMVGAAFIDEMCHTHRLLQGNLIENLLVALGDYGGMFKEHPERFADLRNEFHLTLLRKLRERLKDELFWRDK